MAIIFNEEGKILLTKRFEPTHKPSHNKWQLPGGGIEKGESIAQAAIRETREEANIEIRLLQDTPVKRIETISKKRQEYITLYGFPASYESGTISCENDDEASEIGWFEYEKIDFSNTLSGTKELIDECLKLWKKD